MVEHMLSAAKTVFNVSPHLKQEFLFRSCRLCVALGECHYRSQKAGLRQKCDFRCFQGPGQISIVTREYDLKGKRRA